MNGLWGALSRITFLPASLRSRMLQRLSASHSQSAVRQLIRTLAANSPDTRDATVRALKACGLAVVHPATELFTTGAPGLRVAAAEALALTGPAATSALPALQHSLTAAPTDVRISALRALGAMGSAALPAIDDIGRRT